MDALSEIFSFQGRANRAWYIGHVIVDDFVILSLIVLMLVLGVVTGTPLFVLPLVGVLFGAVVAATAVSVKRLHDLNMSGWHLLGMMIPIYNLYLGLKMVFVRGTTGPNRFGNDPLMSHHPLESGEGEIIYELESP